MQVAALVNVGGNSLTHIIKGVFDKLNMSRFSLERPRDGKEALKPLRLFNIVCSKSLVAFWTNGMMSIAFQVDTDYVGHLVN